MDKIVFATANCGASTSDGLTYQLRAGDVWDAEDPIVIHNPGLFSEAPPFPFPLRTEARRVEQATAAPGERRNR